MKNNLEEYVMKEFLLSRKKKNFFTLKFFLTLILILILILIIFISYKYKNKPDDMHTDHIALINIHGIISDRGEVTSNNIVNIITKAFNNEYAKAVIIKINSPGGTPVQSNIIHNHIKKFRNMYPEKRTISVIEDIGTSGAYLVAAATDEIYCDPSSIVGSIGVILSSFGFVKMIDKLGIEYRLYKSGEHKAMMDPFTEQNVEENNMIKNSLNEIHEQFKNSIIKSRKDKIDFNNDHIFSGRFWIGSEALKLGLVDGFYDVKTISSDVLNISKIINYDTINDNIYDSILKSINKTINK